MVPFFENVLKSKLKTVSLQYVKHYFTTETSQRLEKQLVLSKFLF